jgi:hypothetical protein
MPKMYRLFHISESKVIDDLGAFPSKTLWKKWFRNKKHYISWCPELDLYWRIEKDNGSHPEYLKLYREEFELFGVEITEEELKDWHKHVAEQKAEQAAYKRNSWDIVGYK